MTSADMTLSLSLSLSRSLPLSASSLLPTSSLLFFLESFFFSSPDSDTSSDTLDTRRRESNVAALRGGGSRRWTRSTEIALRRAAQSYFAANAVASPTPSLKVDNFLPALISSFKRRLNVRNVVSGFKRGMKIHPRKISSRLKQKR